MAGFHVSPFIHYNLHIEPFMNIGNHPAYVGVLGLEVVLNVAVLVENTVLGFVLYRSSTICATAKTSLANVAISIMGFAVVRILLVINVYSGFGFLPLDTRWAGVIYLGKDVMSYADYFIKVVALLERCLHVFSPRSSKNSAVSLIQMFVPWPFAVLFGIAFVLRWIGGMRVTLTLIIALLLSLMAFVVLFRASRHMYNNRKSERLEERYSIAENVRTTRTLFVWCVASTTRNLVILGVNSFVGYRIVPRNDVGAMRAANCGFNLLIEAYDLRAIGHEVAVVLWAAHFAILASPLGSQIFIPSIFIWDYSGSTTVLSTYIVITKVETMASFITAAFLHFVIFIFVACKRKTAGFKWSETEQKLLAQAAIIAIYDIGVNLPWVLNVLPTDNALLFELLWLYTAAVNPVVYFALNPREICAALRPPRLRNASTRVAVKYSTTKIVSIP